MTGAQYYRRALDWRWLASFVMLLLLGTGIAYRQASFLMPDEGAHYLRAYEVSHLHLVNFRGTGGVDIPCNEYLVAAQKYNPIPVVQQKAIDGRLDPLCRVRSVNPAGAYSFVPYVPAAIALRLTEKLKWQVEDRLVAARTANFAVWFSILFCGLLLINTGRMLMACLVLMPSFFWQLVALSADGATFTFCLVYVFLVLHVIQQDKNITPKLLAVMVSTAALIGASKGIYAPLSLLSFALWHRIAGTKLPYRIAVSIAPAVASFGVFVVLATVSDSTLIHIGNGANPALQVRYLMENPAFFSEVLYRAISNTDLLKLVAPTYAVPNEGRAFGIMLTTAVTVSGLLLFSGFGVNKKFRLLCALLAIFQFASFCLPIYLTYTPVGAADIMGIQGRYYLPIFPLLFIAVSINIEKIKQLMLLGPVAQKSGWLAFISLLSLVVAYFNIK